MTATPERRALGGWARLWIAFTILTWGFVVWGALTNVGLPPEKNPGDSVVCVLIAQIADTEAPALSDCVGDPQQLEAARAYYGAWVASYPTRLIAHLLPGILLPFLFAATFFVARWIMRGFKR